MLKKRLLLIIFASLILITSVIIPASATTFYYSSGYELYKSDTNDGWIINSTSLTYSEVSLPGYLLNDNVTAVGGNVFENRSDITYV